MTPNDIRQNRATHTPVAVQFAGTGGRALQGVSTTLMLVYLFIILTRLVAEIGPLRSLHIPAILSVIMLLVVMVTGGFNLLTEVKVSRWVAGFVLWFLAAIPFGTWRGGSVRLLQEVFGPALVVYVVLAGLPLNINGVLKLLKAAVVFCAVTGFVAPFFPHFVEGGRLGGTVHNPNDLAAVLVLGLALSWLSFSTAKSTAKRIVLALMLVPLCKAFFATGSRGGMLGLAVIGIVVLWRATLKVKVALLVGAVLVVTIMAATVQHSVWARYSVILDAEEEEEDGDEMTAYSRATAVSSSQSRWQLFVDSVWITIYNPLFGVGPGNFQNASRDYQLAQGRRPSWRVTHNTNTGISSELGIPGLVFYWGIIGCSLRLLSAVRKRRYAGPRAREIHEAAKALQLAWIAYLILSILASFEYHFHWPMLAGFSAALWRASREVPVDSGAGVDANSRVLVLQRQPRMAARA